MATPKKFNFQAACTAMLKELGAVEDTNPHGYGLVLDTVGGTLQCKAYDNWLATRFDDVRAAKLNIYFGQLNTYSGKWNWHFTKPSAEDLAGLKVQLQRVLVKSGVAA